MTLYEQLHAAGCQIDSHASDLYVMSTPRAREIVRASGWQRSFFVSDIDGKVWIEVPFAFDPWWHARELSVGT